MLIPIILGSNKDLKYGEIIKTELEKYELQVDIRICSAHKYPERLLSPFFP